MNPDQPTTESIEQKRFSVAFVQLDEWIEEQKRNRSAGRIDINVEYLMSIVSDFSTAARDLRMSQTNEEKKTKLSEIEAKFKEALAGLSIISDPFEQMDIFIMAKRLLLEVHVAAREFLSQ